MGGWMGEDSRVGCTDGWEMVLVSALSAFVYLCLLVSTCVCLCNGGQVGMQVCDGSWY